MKTIPETQHPAMLYLPVTLANGRRALNYKLRDYFDGIFRAEESGEEFPVNLAHVYTIGYSRKDNALAALRKNFIEGTDFQVSLKVKENSEGGRPEEVYMLTTTCTEYFTVRANREVFEVYVNCRKAIKNIMRGALPDFSDPVAAARAWADAEEGKRLALAQANESAARLELARPKIEFAEAVALAANTLSMAEAAKWLKIKGMGRNLLCERLRTDGIFTKRNEPLQQYMSAGYFEVKAQTFAAGAKGQRVGCTPRVTTKGIEWLQKRLKKQPQNI